MNAMQHGHKLEGQCLHLSITQSLGCGLLLTLPRILSLQSTLRSMQLASVNGSSDGLATKLVTNFLKGVCVAGVAIGGLV